MPAPHNCVDETNTPVTLLRATAATPTMGLGRRRAVRVAPRPARLGHLRPGHLRLGDLRLGDLRLGDLLGPAPADGYPPVDPADVPPVVEPGAGAPVEGGVSVYRSTALPTFSSCPLSGSVVKTTPVVGP